MKKYILVIGCSTVDESFYEKDKTSKISFGGKGSNQAIATAKAGSNVVFLTRLSLMKEDKKMTRLMTKNFKKYKIDKRFIEFDKEHHNDYTRVEVAINGNNKLIESPDISKTFKKSFISKNEKLIKNADFVVIQLKVPNEVTKEVFRLCKKFNVKTVLTPCRTKKARENMDFIENATYVTCNEKEANEIFGKEVGGKFELDKNDLNKVLKRYPNKLIVTLGKNGVKWFDGKKIKTEKAIKVYKVIDTTGAGDTFCGNFVSCLHKGEDIYTAIKKGMCASALKIQVAGTQDGMPLKKDREKLFENIFSKEK